MTQTFGYRPDPVSNLGPDGRPFVGRRSFQLWGHEFEEAPFAELRPRLAAGLGDIDLSRYTTTTSQLSLGACAGNSTTDSVEVLNRIDAEAKGLPLDSVPELSRLFTYAMARMLQDDDGDGKNDLNLDEGTYVRLCFDVLSRFGVCRESTYPYDPTKVFVSPTLKAQREAVGHRIHSYYRIRSEGDDRIDEVVSALRSRHPVVFGTSIEQSFMSINDDTPVGPPQGNTIGGHAMVIVGYIAGSFLVKNSWGANWGAGGFWFMRPDYLTWSSTQDLWVPTLGSTFVS